MQASWIVGLPSLSPFAHIGYFTVPYAARVGDPIQVQTMVQNTGDQGADFFINYWRIVDYGTGEIIDWGNSETVFLNPGDIYIFTNIIDYMPNVDTAWYRARSLYIVGPFWARETFWSEDFDSPVRLLVDVATSLSLGLSPSKVLRGGTYSCSGRLTRNDSGGGVAGQTILLERYEDGGWVVTGTTVTNGNGDYGAGFNAPAAAGNYAIRAEFYGGYVFAAASAQAILQAVQGLALPVAVNPVIPLIVGGGALAFLFAGTRR